MINLLIAIITTFFLSSVQAQMFWGDIIEQVDFDHVDLKRPVGAYKKLIEWELPKREENPIFQCLIYKVPHTKEQGKFYIRTFNKKGCQIGGHFEENLLASTSTDVMIKTLTDYSGFHLQVIDGSEIVKLVFPQAGNKKRWKTLHFTKRAQSIKSTDIKIREGDYCLKWKKSCEPEGINQCSSCPSGMWSESLNYKNCPSKITALCGQRSCGGKNQPGCLKMVSLRFPLTCEEALEFVVCAPMLIPHCEGTGEIICR